LIFLFILILERNLHYRRLLMSKRILVLGATGPTGLAVVREALSRGHVVVAYVRTPSKIPSELAANKNLNVIEGELSSTANLSAALKEVDSVVSLLGPNKVRHPPVNHLSQYYPSIFDAMRESGVRRISALSTVSLKDPADKFSWARSVLALLVRIISPGGKSDFVEIGEQFDKHTSDLDWVLFRVAMLKDGGEGKGVAGYVGDGKTTMTVWRAELARWIFDDLEIEQSEWLRKKPVISRPRE